MPVIGSSSPVGSDPVGNGPDVTPSIVTVKVSVMAVPSDICLVRKATASISVGAPRSTSIQASSPSPADDHSVPRLPSIARCAEKPSENSELAVAVPVGATFCPRPVSVAGGVRNVLTSSD